MKSLLVSAFLLPNLVYAFAAANDQPQLKSSAFIDALMKQMTLSEKVGQLQQYTAEMSVTGSSINENYRKEIEAGRVGSVFNAYTPAFTRDLQKIAVDRSRLKIPLIFAYDVVHGHKTIFPIPLAESGSFDLALIEKSARIAATEAAADGLHWTFGPMVDIARDPRWGRVAEGAGEDPWWGQKVAAARVRGLQGEGLGQLDSVMACVKHFAAYGAPIAGRDYNSVDMSERELLETYLPPYEAAVRAGAATVMTSFNDIAGVPSTANPWLLTRLLRDTWGFKGFVVTDYTAVRELKDHGVAATDAQATELAFKAGVDMDMQDGLFSQQLPELVHSGVVSIHKINLAVRRILDVKNKLGLFSDPYRFSDEARAKREILSAPHREQAREVARHSIVLLKNEANVLPLKKAGTIALIGPFASEQHNNMGNWSAAGTGDQVVSLERGLREAIGDQARILVARGTNFLPNSKMHDLVAQQSVDLASDDKRPSDELLSEALSVVRRADVVVMALGEVESLSGEAASRTHLRVPENQLALLRAVRARTTKPIVLVLFNGRPLVLEAELPLVQGLVEGWFLGVEAGHALADVLTGAFNPSARLTISFPVNEGQIPIYYSARHTGRPEGVHPKYASRYLDAPNEPQFPFGFGLSYTTFAYAKPELSQSQLKMGDTIKVHTKVTNAGTMAGEEVVQLYIHQKVASIARPVKVLRGFRKIALKPGETREVEFALQSEDFKFYNAQMKWVAEPGPITVMVGGNSRDTQAVDFTLAR